LVIGNLLFGLCTSLSRISELRELVWSNATHRQTWCVRPGGCDRSCPTLMRHAQKSLGSIFEPFQIVSSFACFLGMFCAAATWRRIEKIGIKHER
jgi:hypothetical protein